MEPGQEWALEVECRAAKDGKDALKRLGWLDSGRRSQLTCDGSKVAFPVTMQGAQALLSIFGGERGQDQCEQLVGSPGASLVSLELPGNRRSSIAPQQRLRKEVLLLLQERGLDEALVEELPTKWERIGDLVILPGSSLRSELWKSLGSPLWKIIAECLGVTKVARQGPVASTGTRDSGVEMLLGEDGWVEHRENAILYCFDATKCMFSSGNVTERSRMGELNCENDVIVDLFAGIGYFVLPFLVRARAKHVYACEWNPHALYALRRNLRASAVEKRCTVIEGDNRLTAPREVADRVCLGLLPSSEGSWAVAVRALKSGGGILHVHENIKDVEEEDWIEYLTKSLQTLANAQGRSWEIRVNHIEHVKWYAPHVRHIVADVWCSSFKET
ncbi:tRNA wybutosine-synthesizing protein 2/3/4 isoform X1 [Selaginella moellendorffii]|nr:tRNA wybutosine-synthesizing protein 2/3/4 isoform X1 [Selaginella moellendorffii]XP_024541426.1 tRNA wybutosine-synthesizing protein 2/3/4 isoform X1 [Selaginella moellendorffii]XP_024541427.1 tRNA wybutosine-synthesizing protein 2/3/4 isoform X1 [Selaginella moellendorffii]|eukprot:XP_002980586.2 tRNA wybutosine-synthesizing protein 2/3/4 isoform X1 [Selaginella moellendorffii]